jgi:hypothetical protein
MVGLLMLAATAHITPKDRAFVAQAQLCGIKPDQIAWTKDDQGRSHPSITPNGDLDSLPFTKFKCMLEWAARTHTKFGFVSEPDPTR